MAKPNSRQELIDYCLRKLGSPILEINLDDDQIDDCVDDALQYFQERHFDGVERMYLKYAVTQEDIDRGKANLKSNVGIVTTTGTATINGQVKNFSFFENSNFIQVPDTVIGIEKIWKFDSSTISGGMFSIKYQIFLNDLYYFNSIELLNYAMVKTYLEDLSFLLTPDKQIRFNKRQNRLYLDIDWGSQTPGNVFIIDCYRILDPNTFTKVYNDSFLKRYLTALLQKQWGTNLFSKFKGVKLAGGIEYNGSELYENAVAELDKIKSEMMLEHELPPYDFIG